MMYIWLGSSWIRKDIYMYTKIEKWCTWEKKFGKNKNRKQKEVMWLHPHVRLHFGFYFIKIITNKGEMVPLVLSQWDCPFASSIKVAI